MKQSHEKSQLYRSPETLEKDLERLKKIGQTNFVEIFGSRIPEKLFEEYLKILVKPWGFKINLEVCNTFCTDVLSFLKHLQTARKTSLLELRIFFECRENPKLEKGKLLNKQQNLTLRKLLIQANNQTKTNISPNLPNNIPYCLTVNPKIPELAKQLEKPPINWYILPVRVNFKSKEEEFKYLHKFSEDINCFIPLRYFVPDICKHYKFLTDEEIYNLPPKMPNIDKNFHTSLIDGLKKRGLAVPYSLKYLAWIVKIEKTFVPQNIVEYIPVSKLISVKKIKPTNVKIDMETNGIVLKIINHSWQKLNLDTRIAVVVLPVGTEAIIDSHTRCRRPFRVDSKHNSNIKLLALILSLQKLNLKNLCEIHSLFTEEQLEIKFVLNNGSEIFVEKKIN